jgi:hypothetical protein
LSGLPPGLLSPIFVTGKASNLCIIARMADSFELPTPSQAAPLTVRLFAFWGSLFGPPVVPTAA